MPAAAPAQSTIAVRELRCKGCDMAIGVCSDNLLSARGLIFRNIVTFECEQCGQVHTWRPGDPSFLAVLPVDEKGA